MLNDVDLFTSVLSLSPQAMQRTRTEQQIPHVLGSMLFPAVRLMSWTDTPYYMTPHDIRHLPREAFAKLYTVRLVTAKCIAAPHLLYTDW